MEHLDRHAYAVFVSIWCPGSTANPYLNMGKEVGFADGCSAVYGRLCARLLCAVVATSCGCAAALLAYARFKDCCKPVSHSDCAADAAVNPTEAVKGAMPQAGDPLAAELDIAPRVPPLATGALLSMMLGLGQATEECRAIGAGAGAVSIR